MDVGKESDDTEDEEYDWVTDTDTEEENPQFQCDTCGKAMEDTEDRYHCDTCSDYDLVRPKSRRTRTNCYVCCCVFFVTLLLSSFWTSRGHRCRPFSPPVIAFNFYRA